MGAADVRLRSLADIAAHSRHVRFTPNIRYSSVRVGCPLSANSRHVWIGGGMSSLPNRRSYSLAVLGTGNESIVRLPGLLPQSSFIPVLYGAAESLNDALDAELAVAKALEDLGFTTEIMEVELELASIETLPSRRPLLVFNLVDAINCDGRFAPLVTARLDALGIAYTGCNTSALLKTLSKVGTKLKLRHAGLPTPEWSADGTGLDRDAQVIVKALWEHGSLGLDKTSVMRCEEAQQVLVARTLSHKTEHFAEAYIDGREFNLSLLEHSSGVEVLPIAEILFEGLEANAPKIVDFDAKWTPDSRVYIGTPRRFGLERNEPELAKKLKQLALASWNLFGLNGYARFDFRIDPTGKPFVIDVNPNPFLAQDAGFAAAAAEAGLSYQDLIGRIVELAWRFARQGTWFAA